MLIVGWSGLDGEVPEVAIRCHEKVGVVSRREQNAAVLRNR
jgi:hypothetical protein